MSTTQTATDARTADNHTAATGRCDNCGVFVSDDDLYCGNCDSPTDDLDAYADVRDDAKPVHILMQSPRSMWHNDIPLGFTEKQYNVIQFAGQNPHATLRDIEDAGIASLQYARDVLYRVNGDRLA